MPEQTIRVTYTAPGEAQHRLQFNAPGKLRLREIWQEIAQRVDLDHCTINSVAQHRAKKETTQ